MERRSDSAAFVTLPIDGMKCAACTKRIRKLLLSIDGVSKATVNLAERKAVVRYAPSRVAAMQLVAAVNGFGYRAGRPVEEK